MREPMESHQIFNFKHQFIYLLLSLLFFGKGSQIKVRTKQNKTLSILETEEENTKFENFKI